MPHAMLKVSLIGFAICFLGGCGASQTTAPRAPDTSASVMPLVTGLLAALLTLAPAPA